MCLSWPCGTKVIAQDRHDILVFFAKTQFGAGKQPVDDKIGARHAIVYQLGLAVPSDDKERWRLALVEPVRKLDICSPSATVRQTGQIA